MHPRACLTFILLLGSARLLAAEADPSSPRELIRLGSDQLVGGEITHAIKSFERAVTLQAELKPHLWQLGIAYYYADRFAEGSALFTSHQAVNPEDVENAVWHFLCEAREFGLEKARKNLIPITRDTRVPMKEVHALFAGTGTQEQVIEAASRIKDDSARKNALCYAHLYLALYYEALGNPEKALKHSECAAHEFRQGHYMGRIAQLHFKLRNIPASRTENP